MSVQETLSLRPIQSREMLATTTTQPEVAAAHLGVGGVVATSLLNIDAFVWLTTPEATERAIEIKGRDKGKTFTHVTNSENADLIAIHHGIAPHVSEVARQRGIELLHLAAEGPGIGVMWDANTENLDPIYYGITQLDENTKVHTASYMVSNDQHFGRMLSHLEKQQRIVGGTSLNKGGDRFANGSGLHDHTLELFDFEQAKGLCFLLEPEYYSVEKPGTSLSTVYITPDGNAAYIRRVGSTTIETLSLLLRTVGISEIHEVYGGANQIGPYKIAERIADIKAHMHEGSAVAYKYYHEDETQNESEAS